MRRDPFLVIMLTVDRDSGNVPIPSLRRCTGRQFRCVPLPPVSLVVQQFQVVSFRAFGDTLNLPDIVVPKYLKKPVISNVQQIFEACKFL